MTGGPAAGAPRKGPKGGLAGWLMAVALLLAGAACAAPKPRGPRHRPGADRLLALVPEGADAVGTVNLRQLRTFWRARPWSRRWAKAQGALQARLPARFDPGLLHRADRLLGALWISPDGRSAKLLLLLRSRDGGPRQAREPLGTWLQQRFGEPPRPRALGPGSKRRPPPSWERYRGVAMRTHGGEAIAVLDPHTVASGPTLLVRQCVDLLRALPGQAAWLAGATAQDWWSVAGPDAGQAPLVALAARLPPSIQGRLRQRLGLKVPIRSLALRLSAAGWLSLRAWLDVDDRPAARVVIARLKAWVGRQLSGGRGGAALRQLLGAVAVHHEGGRIHVQWALPLARLDGLVTALSPGLMAKPRGSSAPARP